MITFSVEVWSWKLCQIKDPLVFGAAICSSVNLNIVLHGVVWSSRSSARCFDALCSVMFWITEPRNAAPKANGYLICHNFQDQTSTETVITPPKSMYSPGLNGICYMSGTFHEGRCAKFWYVLNIYFKSGIFSQKWAKYAYCFSIIME